MGVTGMEAGYKAAHVNAVRHSSVGLVVNVLCHGAGGCRQLSSRTPPCGSGAHGPRSGAAGGCLTRSCARAKARSIHSGGTQ
jgi:hypothetical protein